MGPSYHKVQVNIVDTQRLQRGGNAVFDAVVPWVVQLSRNPDFLARDTGILDSLANLMFIAIRKSSIDMSIPLLQSNFYSFAHLIGLGLPGSEADGGHLGPGVEGESSFGVLGHFADSRFEHSNDQLLKQR